MVRFPEEPSATTLSDAVGTIPSTQAAVSFQLWLPLAMVRVAAVLKVQPVLFEVFMELFPAFQVPFVALESLISKLLLLNVPPEPLSVNCVPLVELRRLISADDEAPLTVNVVTVVVVEAGNVI